MTEPRRAPRTLPEILEVHERIIIIQAIQECGGSRTQAARTLGIRRRYLYSRIRHLGIDLGMMPARQGRPRGEEGDDSRREDGSS